MKKMIFAIGIIALILGLSTWSVGGVYLPPRTVQKAEGETMAFRYAHVMFAVKNPTEFTYEHVIGGKITKNSVYNNVTLSGELWTGGIFSIIGILLNKYWLPSEGVQVTVKIGKFIGRFFEDTYQGEPYVGLSGFKNGGLGFDIVATNYTE